jgi:hypothetical protein
METMLFSGTREKAHLFFIDRGRTRYKLHTYNTRGQGQRRQRNSSQKPHKFPPIRFLDNRVKKKSLQPIFVLEDPIVSLNPNRPKNQQEEGALLRLHLGRPGLKHTWPPLEEAIHIDQLKMSMETSAIKDDNC